MGKVGQLFYLAHWFFRARILGRHAPLQSVVFVTSGCDSSCRHCSRCNVAPGRFKSFEDINRDLLDCWSKGARILDIEGVALTDWKDGASGPADIFAAAKEIGFFNISTMVPASKLGAWRLLNAPVDLLWVSISGAADLHYLDGAGASLYMVINRCNRAELPEILEYVSNHPKIQQIAFNFHTPFTGTEKMALSPSERSETISQLIAAKKNGARIMNTVSGLRNMLTLDFKRCCWVCNFAYCDGRKSPVCIDDETSGICSKCGFSMAGEMNALLRFRPDTIFTGLRNRSH